MAIRQSDAEEAIVLITRATMIFAACAAVNSCNLGFDIGISTQVGVLIQKDMNLSVTQREIFVGSINFYASKL